jgi:hypothetical protein
VNHGVDGKERLDATITFVDSAHETVVFAHPSDDYDHDAWFSAYTPQKEDGCYIDSTDGLSIADASKAETVCWWHMACGRVLGVHNGMVLENDITDILDDTFTVIDERTKKYVDLCADGGNRAVTEDNKVEYVKLRVAWLVKYSVHQLVDPFVNAFWNVIPLKILRECNISPTELVSLFRGSPSINIDDIRAYCVFQGSKSFNDQCEAVMTLWCVLREMRQEHRRMFLAFVTGAARAPLDGFVPPFNLTEGRDMPEDSLPRAHTCFNQLVLPRYSSADMLRERLTFAIENCVGFELA